MTLSPKVDYANGYVSWELAAWQLLFLLLKYLEIIYNYRYIKRKFIIRGEYTQEDLRFLKPW